MFDACDGAGSCAGSDDGSCGDCTSDAEGVITSYSIHYTKLYELGSWTVRPTLSVRR